MGVFGRGGPIMTHEKHTVVLGNHLLVPYWSFRMNGKKLKFLFQGKNWPDALTSLLGELEKREVMTGNEEGELLTGTFPLGSNKYRCEVDTNAYTLKLSEL